MKTLTSIIILTYNQLEYTKQCIDSIRKYTEPGTYELIVIDNKSTDGTPGWLSQQHDILAVLNDRNEGFPKGCNQGITLAKGENVLLLNNDVVVTPRWLELLVESLYSDERIAAVGPVTNSMSNFQQIDVPYQTIEEMFVFADQFNRSMLNTPEFQEAHEYRLRLMGYCLLIKRKVIDQIGLLDERFTPGNFEDDDYSFRMIEAGYHLVLCKNVFIHHYGSVSFGAKNEKYMALMNSNKQKFVEKWGFEPGRSSLIRNDIIHILSPFDRNAVIRVLEIGCLCGGTLMGIKGKFKNAELHGIEENKAAAAMASNFASVKTANIEESIPDYPANYFDYIILADTLEHLQDPWEVVKNLSGLLKPSGKIVASIPNFMHYCILREVLYGRGIYKEPGVVDRSQLRLFTQKDIKAMFTNAGFLNLRLYGETGSINDLDQQFVDELVKLAGPSLREQYETQKYLVEANSSNFDNYITDIVERLSLDMENEEDLLKLLDSVCDGNLTNEHLIRIINSLSCNRIEYANKLAIFFYNNGLFNMVIPLLQYAIQLDSNDENSLYNLGYILFKANEYELALHYLDQIQNKDEDICQLMDEIRQGSGGLA
ncbi:glycosyltransferase [Paenibacillus macerans]|uniref:glycosyltransferase n=1 Tax=Paenibacillus macerans TaxID=44252 RepID=UPI001BCC2A20|nr:glycosyltransferase [Paenibacillus macerans]